MGVNQLSREELQTVALENCPAELFYELEDQLGEIDEATLLILAEHKAEEGLTPYLLGRLAYRQGIKQVQDDPLLMELLESIPAPGASEDQWLAGWLNENERMG